MTQDPKKGLLPKIGHFLQTGQWVTSNPVALGPKLAKKDEQTIIQIVQEFKDKSIKDIQEWRKALEACEDINTPRWNMLQDLYDYLEPDAQLGTAKDIRVASTLGKRYIIYDKKSGKELPEKTELFKNKEWFFNFVWEFLESIFQGYTAAQLIDPTVMKFFFVPRRNIIPQLDFVLFEVGADKGISLIDPAIAEDVIFLKYKRKFGILNDIVPNLIWKKNARQAWSEFGEKFGIPPIWATSNKSDTGTINKIEAMLKKLGEAATAVLPEGTTVNIQDQVTKGDPHAVWMKQMEIDDQQIAKRLLGGTMITDSGSSRSQSEVHERTLKDVITLFDQMLVLWLVNDYLIPLMGRNGYPLSENDGFKFDDSEKLPMKDHWGIVYQALDKFEIDYKWVAETFNIPITGVKATPTPGTPPKPEGSFNSPATAMAAALAGHGVMLPNYTSSCGHNHTGPVASFTEDLLSELSDALINDVWKGNDTMINEVLKSIKAYELLLNGLHSSWQGFDNMSYDGEDVHCLSMMEYNLFEFSRLKEKANVFALNELLIDKEKNNIRDFTDFRNQALQYLKNPDVNWLQHEYNYTIAVGQGASRYHQFMNERTSVTNYGIIQTVGDSRVRAKHRLLDGKLIRFDQKGGVTIWVPFDIGCRCEILQYLGKPTAEQLISNDEIWSIIDKKEGDKWTGNKAVMEQVFAANEMYLNDNNLVSESKKLDYAQYGLKAFADLKASYPALNIDKTITSTNVSELWNPETGKNYMGFEDHLNRKMIMPKSVFDYHIKDRYTTPEEQRHQLFPHIADVLADPDEVYFTQRKEGNRIRYQTNYIKFWNNEAIVVNTQTGSNAVEINTWYKLKGEKEVRRGYLVYQKKKP